MRKAEKETFLLNGKDVGQVFGGLVIETNKQILTDTKTVNGNNNFQINLGNNSISNKCDVALPKDAFDVNSLLKDFF